MRKERALPLPSTAAVLATASFAPAPIAAVDAFDGEVHSEEGVSTAAVVPAAAATTTTFRANVHDLGVCSGVDLCGTGVIQGYGTVTTTLTFATLERVFVLDSDGSTLTLLLEPTGTTGSRQNGTWTIIGGTGVFAGAEGSREVWVTPTGVPSITTDTAQYRPVAEVPGAGSVC